MLPGIPRHPFACNRNIEKRTTVLDNRFNGGISGRNGSGGGGGGGGGKEGDTDGDTWPRSPRPRSSRDDASAASVSASASSSSLDDSDSTGDGENKRYVPDQGGREVHANSNRRHRRRYSSRNTRETAEDGGEAEKEVPRDGRGGSRQKGAASLIGQVSGLRKGSASSFALNGESIATSWLVPQ